MDLEGKRKINSNNQSIDGFYRPPVRQRPLDRPKINLRFNEEHPAPVATPPTRPLLQVEQQTVDQAKSIVGVTLTNQQLQARTSGHDLRPTTKSKKRHWSTKRKIVTSFLMILILGFGIGTWYGAKLLNNFNKVFHGNIITDAQALTSEATLKGESSGRINILLAGDSADDPNHQGADLTDSIMVVSIDLKTHNGFMLSVPRDLWVDLPGWGQQKINAANEVNNFSEPGYPSGGMGQLQEIVQSDLGIPIDYYSLIDYGAFRDAVNAVGGITVDIQSPDPRGLYDAFTNLKLPNGEDALDGQQALNLARARGDNVAGDISYGFPDSDYDRTMHQREMLTAIAKKATSVGVLSNPLKVSDLFNAFGNNVSTNLNVQDLLTLIKLTKGMNFNNLQSETYTDSGSNALLEPYTDPDSGAEALIPVAGLNDFSQLKQFYKQLSSSNPIVQEAPTIEILNASNVNGLAKKEQTVLQNEGFNVLGIATAGSPETSTMVVNTVGSSMPAALSSLEKTFPGTTATNTTSSPEAGLATNYSSDFIVIIGQNWANANSSSESATSTTSSN